MKCGTFANPYLVGGISPQPGNQPPKGQDAQINSLSILSIFVKQRTYLIILLNKRLI